MATQQRNIVVSLLFTLFGGPGIVLFWLPWAITRFHLPQPVSVLRLLIGAALIVLGLIPLFESIVRFIAVGKGTLVPRQDTQHLVVSGLYRFVRNPMYVGVLAALAGEAILFRSRGLLIELAIVALVFHLFVSFYEEPKLTRTFGEEYLRYKQNVRRWIPRLSPWRG